MAAARILVVDDEPDIRGLVGEILGDEGYRVDLAADAGAARLAKQSGKPDLVLLDIWMPDVDGISLLREWADGGALDCAVIMMSGHGSIETAVEATRLGAWDFIEKPIALAKLLLTVQRALEAGRLRKENAGLRARAKPVDEPIGQSQLMRDLREQLLHLAPLDQCVLLEGDDGSGKEELARWMHAQADRADQPFEVFACSDSADSSAELFGSKNHPGALQRAAGGTLYLENVDQLPAAVQHRLAEWIKQRAASTAGAEPTVRIIAASQRPATELLAAGDIDNDLHYQLAVAAVAVPPLRARSEDVPALLRYYAELFAERDRLPYRQFPVAAQNRLRQYNWPGNLRELKMLVQRLLLRRGADEIADAEINQALEAAQHPPTESEPFPLDLSQSLREARESFEREYLGRQLAVVGGSVAKLARRVGLERTHLYRKLRDLGVDLKGNRDD